MIQNIFFLFVLFLPGISHAINAGNTAANFLKIGVGARAIAMGGAYAGIADDITAIYWNPAGLGHIQHKEIFLIHNEWLQGVNHDVVAFGIPTKYGVFALNSNLLVVDNDNSNWQAKDMSHGIYWGYCPKNLSLGIGVKSVSQQIASRKGSSFATDMGILYNFLPWMRMGISCQNIGQGLKMINEKDPLPFTVRVGEAFTFSNSLLLLGMSFPIDNKPSYAIGMEYTPIKCMSIRYGWQSQNSKVGSLHGFTEGTSIGIGVKSSNLIIDYAYLPYGILGKTQQVSLCLKFSQTKTP